MGWCLDCLGYLNYVILYTILAAITQNQIFSFFLFFLVLLTKRQIEKGHLSFIIVRVESFRNRYVKYYMHETLYKWISYAFTLVYVVLEFIFWILQGILSRTMCCMAITLVFGLLMILFFPAGKYIFNPIYNYFSGSYS